MKSSDNEFGLINGTSAPYSFATLTMSTSSVETIIFENNLELIAKSIAEAIIG